ncbi:MAG: fatty-acyl-CoA synthase [Hyphomonadaceae bacterium]|nr:MAG: fatty-acyl-CoA synthase [Hyphomonadaceae bacterium]
MDMLPDLLANRAALSPHKIALLELESGKEVSFSELNQRSEKLGSLLNANRISEGDRVAVLCRNRIAFFELLFACAKIGAILVPLNWRAPLAENDDLLARFSPKIIFHGKEDEALARQTDAGLIKIDFDKNYEGLLAVHAPMRTRKNWPSNQIWYLLLTSGTTGMPKAVIQTYGMALCNAVNIGQAIDIVSEDIFLNFLPLFHSAGINLHTLPAIFNGNTSKIISGFDTDQVISLIENGEITAFFGVPAIYLQLSQHPKFTELNLSKMRSFGCGGAPLPDYLVELYANKGALVCNGMGMTETGPTAFMMDKENVKAKIGSVGKPQLLCNVKIVDSQFNEAPIGTAGTLLFSGPGITPGYWQNEAATNEAFHVDESGVKWLKSGDTALQDKDGYYYIVGRTKDMYISGSENVYPAEVENALARHEKITEVAIVAVPDAKWGEVGVALYIANGPIANSDLAAFCRGLLAPFKVPKHFIEVKDFPRTAAGKVQKHLIKLPKL